MTDGIDEIGMPMWKCVCGKYRYGFQITCKHCKRDRPNKGDYMTKKTKEVSWFEKALERIEKGKSPFKKNK